MANESYLWSDDEDDGDDNNNSKGDDENDDKMKYRHSHNHQKINRLITQPYIDGLAQRWSNSITNALELLQSCTRLLI